MKIICAAYLHGNGGAERQIVMLANALAERGHTVYLAAIAECNNRYSLSDNVKLVDLTFAENKGKLNILSRLSALSKLYREVMPDVTIHFWLQSAYLSVLIPKRCRGKTIYSERGDPGDVEYNGILGKIRALTFKQLDGFVFQSKIARNYFDKSVAERSAIIQNSIAVNPEKYPVPCAKREKKIVNVGRLHPQKNQKLLIDAFVKIADRFPDYRLEIYGDGELKDKLTAAAEGYGLKDRVYILGSRSDIFDCVYNAEIFVLSSDYEGMPNCLLEAMALGVPSISTNYSPGGVNEIIADEVSGIITPKGDVDSLADALEYLLSNKVLCEQMALQAKNIINNNSSRNIYDKWELFIQEILTR